MMKGPAYSPDTLHSQRALTATPRPLSATSCRLLLVALFFFVGRKAPKHRKAVLDQLRYRLL